MSGLIPLSQVIPPQPEERLQASSSQGLVPLSQALPSAEGDRRTAGDADLRGYGTSPPPRPEGAARNAASGGNRAIARLIGAPADAAASILEPHIWNKASEEEKSKFRERNPYQSAFMDFMSSVTSDPSLGHRWWERQMAEGGIKTNVEPTNVVEAMAGAAGGAAVDMAVPGLGAEATLVRSWRQGKAMFDAATRSLMSASTLRPGANPVTAAEILKGGGFTSNLAMGAGAGAGGVAAESQAPDALKPAARTVGEMAGGVPAAAATSSLEGAFRSTLERLGRLFENPRRAAARSIAGEAADLPQLRTDLANAPPRGEEAVPGSEPTSFQATGDAGLGAREREVSRGSSYGQQRFGERREEQNSARAEALDRLASPEADPREVTKYVHTRLRDLEDHFDVLVKDAQRTAEDRIAAAPGGMYENPSAYGEAIRDPLAAIHTQQKEAASRLWRAIDPDLDTPVYFRTMKGYFARLENEIPETARQATGEERAIYDMVREMPDETSFGNLVALRSRLTDAIRDERDGGAPTVLRRLSRMLSGVDNALAVVAGDVAKDPAKRTELVRALQAEADAWTTEQARKYNAQRAAVGTETGREVRPGAVPGEGDAGEGLGFTGQGTVRATPGGEGPQGGEPRPIQGGQGVRPAEAAPEITEPGGKIEDRFVEQARQEGRATVLTKEQAHGAPVVYAGVRKDADPEGYVFVSRSQASAERMAGVDGQVVPFRLRPGSTVYPDMARDVKFGDFDGRQSLLRGRREDSLGIVHLDELEPAGGVERGITREMQERYSAARGATREMKGEFERGPVGQVLRPAGDRGSFRLTAGSVARRLFDTPEGLESLAAAAERGTSEQRAELDAAVADYAASSLRKFAVRDGVLSPQRLERWSADHGYAIDRFPELGEKFGSAAEAQRELDAATTRQRESLRRFNDSAAAEFLGGKEPIKVVGQVIKNLEEFGSLVDSMRGNQAALDGLKRAVLEHMTAVGRGTSTAEAGTSGEAALNGAAIQRFYANNREALSRLFSREEMAGMEAVALDIQRSGRSARTPGKTEGAAEGMRNAFQHALTYYGGKATGVAMGAAAGMHHGIGGYIGAAAGLVAGAAVDAAVASRQKVVDRFVVDMMLDRRMLGEWLARIPEGDSSTWGERFLRRVRVLAASQAEEGAGKVVEGTP